MPGQQIPRVVLSPVDMAFMRRRNPWVSVWWSVCLPGFGHFAMGQHLKGFIFMSWEIVVNHLGHVNMAIYHTVLGDINKAKAIIDYRWAILYPLFYVFAMLDSYRLCLDINRLADLESVQRRRRFDRAAVSMIGISLLCRRNPLMAALWSAVAPGLGHLYCDRRLKAFILTAWYLAVTLNANIVLNVFHLLQGDYETARQLIDYQWLLFWPSIYVFGIVDAYQDTVEQNTLYQMAFQYRLRKYIKNSNIQA